MEREGGLNAQQAAEKLKKKGECLRRAWAPPLLGIWG